MYWDHERDSRGLQYGVCVIVVGWERGGGGGNVGLKFF
jgi:hypothetical protein